MKITLLQTDIAWAKPEENMANAEQMILSAPGADLYILPEMWSTGFITDVRPTENSAANALRWMKEMAGRTNAAICGSLAVNDAGQCFNRQYFVQPDGKMATYDKHHLFQYGGEDKYYQTGNQRTVVSFRGTRFLLVTCYDLRFPVWERYQGDYDAIICVANWPESRQNAFQILTRARAIENQAYLIACNRVGDDQYCHYRGQSAVVSPIGKTLAACPPNRPATATFILDMERLQHIRQKFQVLQERDRP
jgi:predicted amidohydrolase